MRPKQSQSVLCLLVPENGSHIFPRIFPKCFWFTRKRDGSRKILDERSFRARAYPVWTGSSWPKSRARERVVGITASASAHEEPSRQQSDQIGKTARSWSEFTTRTSVGLVLQTTEIANMALDQTELAQIVSAVIQALKVGDTASKAPSMLSVFLRLRRK